MKLINISNNDQSTIVLMDTKAPTQTRLNFQKSKAIQWNVNLYQAAIKCINEWGKWYLTVNTVFTLVNENEAPRTLDEMKAQIKEYGNIYIYCGDSDSCDWSIDANVALRHLHDLQHVQYDRDTSATDELFLAGTLADEVTSTMSNAVPQLSTMLPRKAGAIKSMISDIINTDFAAQTRYYQKHGKFVKNQGLFLRTCIFNDESVFNNFQV